MNSTKSIIKVENGRIEFDGKTLPLYKFNNTRYFLDSIPVSLLERDEEAQPRKYDKYQAQKIADSIRRKILMQPLLTRLDKSKQKILITEGQHRWRAMKDILNEERVPCLVYVDLNDHTALLCGLEANAEDRAKGLSGGAIARKTSALMSQFAELLRKEFPDQPITELAILKRMGKTAKSQQRKFLLGRMVQDLRELGNSKIAAYINDSQSPKFPITALNFSFFLQRLIKVTALDTTENNLRNDEIANVLKVTDIFAEVLFEGGKWDPNKSESLSHKHAVNVCRRHPFEACGYFLSKLIDYCGGAEHSIGACYAETTKISWAILENHMKSFLSNSIWNEPHVSNCRSIDELKGILQSAYNEAIME